MIDLDRNHDICYKYWPLLVINNNLNFNTNFVTSIIYFIKKMLTFYIIWNDKIKILNSY